MASYLCLCLLAVLLLVAHASCHNNPLCNAGCHLNNVGVVDPCTNWGSYYQWLATGWWQWVFAQPVHQRGKLHNPALVTGDVDCSVGQSGDTWFLAGIFSNGGPLLTVSRNCSIPAGKKLFFPIVNDEEDNFQSSTNYDVNTLFDHAKQQMDQRANLSVSVDGKPLDWLPKAACPGASCACDSPYRVANGPFSITLPEDSLPDFVDNKSFPPGVYQPVVADGFYMLLEPLPHGKHTIKWHGEIRSASGELLFGLDVTYAITIV